MKISRITALIAATAFPVFAADLAITNVTAYTPQGVLTNATIEIENGRISAINPKKISSDKVIDGSNKTLTPSFVASFNQIGVVEVGAVSASRDGGSKNEKDNITFNPATAFNDKSSLIPVARQGGVGHTLVAPYASKGPFSGVISLASLTGEYQAGEHDTVAIYSHLGAQSKGSRADKLSALVKALAGASEASAEGKKSDKPSASDKLLKQLLNRTLPLAINIDGASEMLTALRLLKPYNLKLIFVGASQAHLIAKQLNEADVSVVISAMANLPESFDALHSTMESAAILEQAGVNVVLTVMGDASHNAYQLRFDAGNAVSHGMSRAGAIAAMSDNVYKMLGVTEYGIRVGAPANVSLWHGDLLDFSGHLDKLWIQGQQQSTVTRQDKLRERYTQEHTIAPAYIK